MELDALSIRAARGATLAAAVAALAAVVPAPAGAERTTLKFAHFWPTASAQQTDIFAAWAKAVESESGGRIKVEIYPAQTLAKAPASYEAVKSRVADMTATVQGYTANRFPLTQVVELPGIARDALVGSCVLQKLYDDGTIAGEYADTKVLFLFTHGHGLLHTKGKPVTKPADLVGMRMRKPIQVVGEFLEAAGARSVGITAPQVYESLQRGVMEGLAMPWEGVYVFRLNEQLDHHTDIDLYTLAFVVAMNKDVYAGLPADLKKAIDDNSGMKWAMNAAKVFDAVDRKGIADAAARGHKIVTVEGGIENPAWKGMVTKATNGYLDEVEKRGKPARKVRERALRAAAECAK